MYTDLKQLREFNPDNYYSEVVELQYQPQEGLKKAIERICNEVEHLVKQYAVCITWGFAEYVLLAANTGG